MVSARINHSSIAGQQEKIGELSLLSGQCAGRPAAEVCIAERYHRVYNTRISEFLPLILCLQHQGTPLAAAGLRPGHYRPMFLEQYLAAPVEQQVAAVAKRPVDRLSLVEIGNFAVMTPGMSTLLLTVAASALIEAGYEWAVFTATRQVERLLKRLGYQPQVMAVADPHRLTGDPAIWGTYYENHPRVMVGNLASALALMEQTPRLRELVAPYREEINIAAASLADYRRLMV